MAIAAAQEIDRDAFSLARRARRSQLAISRLIPALVLYLSLFVLFISLTPSAYRGSTYPKWPGALLVTLWWVAVTMLLPDALRMLLHLRPDLRQPCRGDDRAFLFLAGRTRDGDRGRAQRSARGDAGRARHARPADNRARTRPRIMRTAGMNEAHT